MTTMRFILKPARLLFALSVLLVSTACSSSTTGQTTPASSAYPPVYAELLQKYGTPAGVRYAAWHANPADLKNLSEVADFYATTTPPDKSKSDALAWYLNAYNAWILHNILAKYPTKGPLDGETLFFHGNRIVISGKKTSFNDLEQKVIRPTFKEPRVHFALNCASASCPPLSAKPFDAASLDAELDRLARAFINGKAVQIADGGKTLRLSKIFDWYADDFGGKGSQIVFINHYRKPPIPPDSKADFIDYNWSLNEAP
jgi:hypothetical protein